MALDHNDPLDRLLMESIPHRITPAAGCHMGPTEQFRLLEIDRELWDTIHAVTLDDPELRNIA